MGPHRFFSDVNFSPSQPQNLNLTPSQAENEFIPLAKKYFLPSFPGQNYILSFYPEQALWAKNQCSYGCTAYTPWCIYSICTMEDGSNVCGAAHAQQ